MRLPPKRRLEAILDSPAPKKLVQSMPAYDLYATILDIGISDAAHLARLASPAQFRSLVDLGAWRKDKLDAHMLLLWLRAARSHSGDDFWDKWSALDLELTEHMLRELVTVYDLEEEPDVNPEGVTWESPEGKFLVELKVEGAELSALKSLLQDFASRNPLEAARFLEAVRWEVPAELEETAYQFRKARLLDLGFPEPEQALAIYSYVDVDKLQKVSGAPSPQAGAAMTPAAKQSYFDAALSSLSEEEKRGLQVELRQFINSAMVADAVDPGDLESARRVAEGCRDSFSLGLEFLTDGQPALAADALRLHPLKVVFQAAFSLALKLKFRADRLAKLPLFALDGTPLALRFERKNLESLRRKRPLRALKVDGAEPVPFRNREELEASSALLGRAEIQRAFFAAILGDSPESATAALAPFGQPLSQLEVDRLWNTLVAWAALEKRIRVAPFEPQRLGELCQSLLPVTSERVASIAAAFAARAPSGGEDEIARIVSEACEQLRAELEPPWQKSERVDGRFVPSLAFLPNSL
jgi:hypothetical protein